MLQRLIHRLFLRRHFWRYATFSEVAELYASRTMRIFAQRMIQTFTSVFLYLEGYSLLFLALFWAAYYLLRTAFSWPSAKIVAHFGPKHGALYSNIASAASLAFLPFTGEFGLYALIPWMIFQAFSGALNELSYLVDFSKVKNVEHNGKELGYMNIFEKIANGISPVIGGFLAFWVSPEFVMGVSAAFFLLSAVPLLRTAEPTRLRQKIDFSGFPWRTTWRSLVAEAAIGYDVFSTAIAWVLFMVVIVFAGNGNEMYAKIGVLSSVTLIAALLASYIFGQLIDRRKGYLLLVVSTLMNATVHLFRPFVGTPAGVVAANIANETATTGYAMAFTRGMFDTADNSGRRIAYLFLIEIVMNTGAAIAALVFALLCFYLDDQTSLQMNFIITGLVVLLIATPRFVLYRK